MYEKECWFRLNVVSSSLQQ